MANPFRLRIGILVWLIFATIPLCAATAAEKSTPAKSKSGPLDYPTVGDYTGIDGLRPVRVEGVGLVVGLNKTGGDPPPSRYREKILNEMRRRQVDQPAQMLSSDSTAVVLLRAYIAPGARKGDLIDVEVRVPPGDPTTSLKGGRLLEAVLHESFLAEGRFDLAGQELIKVDGPILVVENPQQPGDATALLQGKILGRGRVLDNRDFRIVLGREHRGVSRVRKIEHVINRRAFPTGDPHQKQIAKAKDEKMLELKLSPVYRYDIERYLLVIRRIPESVSDSFTQRTLEVLRDELNNPARAIEASLRLEAMGKVSTEVLKDGLRNHQEVVRFASASTLAYLGDSSGAAELANLAENSPVYRARALGALVALNHPMSRMKLGGLLHVSSAEARYGAFRSLWAYDRMDPSVRGVRLGDDFYLHVVRGSDSPMVHVARNFRPEIVLFNGNQQLRPPFSLRAGEFIMLNATEDSDRVHLAMFRAGDDGPIRRRSESSLLLAEVIAEATKLGAGYADVVDMLQQASAAGALAGRLEVNALPKPVSLEVLSAIGADESNIAVAEREAPGLFTVWGESKKQTELVDGPAGESEEVAEPAAKRPRGFWPFRRLGN